MSQIPTNLRYTSDHEWVLADGDAWTVGVTDAAQKQLGDIVYLELPKAGDLLTKGQAFGSIESVKAVSDLYAPISGKVLEVNPELESSPEDVNSDPYGDGWIIRVQPSDKSELNELMDAAAYHKLVDSESE